MGNSGDYRRPDASNWALQQIAKTFDFGWISKRMCQVHQPWPENSDWAIGPHWTYLVDALFE